jgi:carboxyl-terminal processing protease
MPDIFVTFDTLGMGPLFTTLRYTSIFQMFAFDFVKDKRTKWSSPIQFKKSFQVNEDLFNSFIKYAEKELEVKVTPGDIKNSKTLLKRTIKAEIARQLWEEQGYYTIINEFDKEVLKCIEVMK